VKKKILGIFVSLFVLAIFAIPLNAVLANKPETITFYGYPLLGAEPEEYFAGKSDNMFEIWSDLGWQFCWDYDVITLPDPPMDVAVPIDVFADGFYDGRWIMHGYVPGDPIGTYASINVLGRNTVTVSDWDGASGEFVLQAVNDRWTIISGTIGGMKLHGGGSYEQVDGLLLWKYEGTVHFSP